MNTHTHTHTYTNDYNTKSHPSIPRIDGVTSNDFLRFYHFSGRCLGYPQEQESGYWVWHVSSTWPAKRCSLEHYLMYHYMLVGMTILAKGIGRGTAALQIGVLRYTGGMNCLAWGNGYFKRCQLKQLELYVKFFS